MAKDTKKGMMNPTPSSGRNGPMNPMGIANLMAKAATLKVKNSQKSYQDPEGDDTDTNDNHSGPESAIASSQKNPSKGGSKHPSAPASKKSEYSGEQFSENEGGADSPSKKSPNKSKSQIQKKK